MCDYSLHSVASRPAKVGEILITSGFKGTSSRGFAARAEPDVAVCLLPGTEIAFEQDVQYQSFFWSKSAKQKTALFRKINASALPAYHDALEFADGKIVLLSNLIPGQHASVLQLPAPPLDRRVEQNPARTVDRGELIA